MGGRGIGSQPVLLDLAGNGITVDTVSTSSQFLELDGDSYQHRTAWAGRGTGVLVIDADGDGKISRSSEFVFTEWDASATGDLAAIRSVFDTNGNGKLDSGDARWSEFKVMVEGQLVTLASLGIVSIGLTPTGSGQRFDDGSAITGTTTFTRSDGSTGAVGDAILVSDADGYIVKQTSATNGDGSTTLTIDAFDKQGQIAFRNEVTTSADGLTRSTKFDDDGNGTWDRSQTQVYQQASPTAQITRTISNFAADGALLNRTTIVTSADRKTVTTRVDQDGDGVIDQKQVYVKSSGGSSTTTVTQLAPNGTVLKTVETKSSTNGLVEVVRTDTTGSGTFELVETETTVVAGNGSRTKTTETRSSNGTLVSKEVELLSADGKVKTLQADQDANGQYETRTESALTVAGGASTTVVSRYNSDNSLRDRVTTTTSASGLGVTEARDLDGDGITDRTASDVTIVNGDGSRTQTIQETSGNGSLLAKSIRSTSVDGKAISILTDANGDTVSDSTKTIVIDAGGATTATTSTINPNGSLSTRMLEQSDAAGLSITTKADVDGNGVYETTVTDVTVGNPDGSRTRTVQTRSTNNTLIGSFVTTTSANSLIETVAQDINGDGAADRATQTVRVLNPDGSRKETVTTTSVNGTLLGKREELLSANRRTTTVTIDANGDTKVDQIAVKVINSDGSRKVTTTDYTVNGSVIGRTEETVSANKLTSTMKIDLQGDGVYDRTMLSASQVDGEGAWTTIDSTTSSNGSLLGKTTTKVSANTLSRFQDFDSDGNGVVERKTSKVTSFDADGSTRTVLSALSASGSLVSGNTTSVSGNGLQTVRQDDYDGNGTVDRTETSTTELAPNGNVTTAWSVKSGDGIQRQTMTSKTSANKRSAEVVTDSTGDGVADERSVVSVNSDGAIAERRLTYASSGSLESRADILRSDDGFFEKALIDTNGDGAVDRSFTSGLTINADGSRTRLQSWNEKNAPVETKSETVSGTSLSVSTTWKDAAGATTRSATSATVLAANGSSTSTTTYLKGDGSLERKTVTAISGDGLSKTSNIYLSDPAVADTTSVMTTLANGSTQEIRTGKNPNINFGFGAAPSKVVSTTTSDGLTSSDEYYEKYYAFGVPFAEYVETRNVSATSYLQDGSKKEVFSRFRGTQAASPTLQTHYTKDTAGNGMGVFEKTDQNGDGTIDRRQEWSVSYLIDGSRRVVEERYTGTDIRTRRIETLSVIGLTRLIDLEYWGGGATRQTATEVTSVLNDGTRSEERINRRLDNSVFSSSIELTSQDGKTKTLQENLDGLGGVDRTIISSTEVLADGSTVYLERHFDVLNALDASMQTVSRSDGRGEIITTDRNGDGKIDQTESSTYFSNGSSRTTTINQTGDLKLSQLDVRTSADGRTTTSEWDFDGNGTIDQSRVSVTTDFYEGTRRTNIADKDAAGAVMSTTVISEMEKSGKISTSIDLDAKDGVDRIDTRFVDSDGEQTREIQNLTDLSRSSALFKEGEVYWRRDQEAFSHHWTFRSDGLTVVKYADYDNNGRDANTQAVNLANFEVSSTSRVQIDSSIIEAVTELNTNGTVKATGSIYTSADGRTVRLEKDSNNDGIKDYFETAETGLDGSTRIIAVEREPSGSISKSTLRTADSFGRRSLSVTATKSSGNLAIDGSIDTSRIAFSRTSGELNVIINSPEYSFMSPYQISVGGNLSQLTINGTNFALLVASAPGSSVNASFFNLNARIFGLEGNEQLTGNIFDDRLFGGGGDDTLTGGDGNDVLDGGTGSDRLIGSAGSDNYYLRRGSGSDIIEDFLSSETTNSADISAANSLNVKAGGIVDTWTGGYYWQTSMSKLLKAADGGVGTIMIAEQKLTDITFSWNGESLRIGYGLPGDEITIVQQKLHAGRVEMLQIGSQAARNFAVSAAPGAAVSGTSGADYLFGLSGAETLSGGDGNDSLIGGDGNDQLLGELGDDVLIGGLGADVINGGAGNDLYVFARGDGLDVIGDLSWITTTASADVTAASTIGVKAGGVVNTWVGGYNWSTASNSLLKLQDAGVADVIRLDGGITVGDLTMSWQGQLGEDLNISIAGSPGVDGILVRQQKILAASIGSVQFGDDPKIRTFVANTNSGVLNGTADNDLLYGVSGGEQLNGGAGNDILIGKAGADTLAGGVGDDVYRFGSDDGQDVINESGNILDNDQLVFEPGIEWNELWFSQNSNDLVISVLGSDDRVTVNNWFAGPGNVVETIRSGDGKTLQHSDVATLVSAMAGFNPATSPIGIGIQPNDPQLGDPAQMGTLAATMRTSWMAA